MERFFTETIGSWKDWGRVFQSIPAFTALAREICRREGLSFAPLENLTPGTNAVFKMGDTVVKIFFPRESGLDPYPDFRNETAVCAWLMDREIPIPPVLAQGFVEDKYRFYYIVSSFFSGQEAGDWLAGASPEQKRSFARQLREILDRMNRPADGVIPPVDLLERALHNPRLDQAAPALQEELKQRAARLDLSERVMVHGDLTGENLLVDDRGGLVVIDCADSHLAPAWYEYGPIVFELFRCDPVLLGAFAGEDGEELIERTLDAVSIHDFGADLLRETAKRQGLPGFTGLSQVRNLLRERLGL